MSSLLAVRAALETQLGTITPPISTVYENTPFTPAAGTPYQAAYLLAAKPDNIEIGPGYTEQGIFQVSLFYPSDLGSGPALTRAEQIRAAFPFRSSFVAAGVTVNITSTPEIAPGRNDGDRYFVPVKVRWSARLAS